MRTRLIVALVALSALTAFAPAPFPRTRRTPEQEIDLARLQGLWRVARFETIRENGRSSDPAWDSTQVLIEKDRWTFLESGRFNAAYRISIDTTKKPVTIDFYNAEDRTGGLFMIGLIRRIQDRIEILYSSARVKGGRASNFDPPPVDWWVLTLRPER